MEINFNEDEEIWDKFVEASPQGNIFVYSKFLDSLNKKYNLVTCYDNNKIIAGAVILFSENGEPLDSVHPFTQYQGILLSDNSHLKIHSKISSEFKVLEFFIQELVRYYKKFCFCQSWKLDDMRPFQWHNYHEPEKGLFNINLRYTAILDLSSYDSFEEYLTFIRTVRRQEFKKSNANLNLKEIRDENILNYLHEKTFQRQGVTRNNEEISLVKSITKVAIDNGYGKLLCSYQNDIPTSSILFLYDKSTAYYLFAANDPEYRNTFSGNFVLLNLIKDAFERKVNEIDFVGANSPKRADYKISYNAVLKPYFITSLT